jgi:diguanylate cyclase (GGDEF)-like protein
MISLRKAMREQMEEAFESTLDSYKGALVAMGDAAARACPPSGEQLRNNLRVLQERLTNEAPPNLVTETEQRLEAELRTWGDQTAQFYQENTDEVKSILSIVSKATLEVGERDQRYAKQFGDLTERLRATNRLNDLSSIRQSLSKSVADLSTCVTKMAKDSQESVAQLRAQLSSYETRLEEVERMASLDELTGLSNRRKVELQLGRRVTEGRIASVIYLDLNEFKQINDAYGHLAGDDLLKQFAGELRTMLRAADILGRWGGDEFIIVVDGDSRQAKALAERIEKWVTGEYVLTVNGVAQKVKISAAIGIASCQPGDTITDILNRADAAMYAHKSQMKSPSRA